MGRKKSSLPQWHADYSENRKTRKNTGAHFSTTDNRVETEWWVYVRCLFSCSQMSKATTWRRDSLHTCTQTNPSEACMPEKKKKWTNHDSPQLEIHQTKLTTPKRNNFTPLYLLGGGANCLYKPQMTKPLRCNLVSNNPKTKWVSFCWPLIREVKLFFHYFEVCGRLIHHLNSLSSWVWVKARQLLPSSARRVSKVP